MNSEMATDQDYRVWIGELKSKFRQAQLTAAIKVNSTLLAFYWELGADIVAKQQHSVWGEGFLTQLSRDLITEFPEVKGFSKRNLEQIRRWYRFWQGDSAIAKQAASQITQIPWWHNVIIASKSQTQQEALYYVANTLKHGWSRSVLTHQIESRLWLREGKATHNFAQTLPATQSDLAQQTLKDPYVFDFLSLTPEHNERELEQALVKHITQFLLELGAGFAYLGKQVPLQVGERDFFLDLLFYHTRLHCYVVVELKTGDFEPEHAGKLNFYLKAVDEQLRQSGDQASIGILLCKHRDKLVAEYALSDINKPIGVSEYQLTQALPEMLKSSLPSIEQIEAELAAEWEGKDD
jgi:predicted nuclease of restriction endonuclease-like (RecB) superfamily